MADKTDKIFGRIAKPGYRALAGAGITTLEQLSQWTEADLSKLHGIGKNGVVILKSVLADHGLSFKQQA